MVSERDDDSGAGVRGLDYLQARAGREYCVNIITLCRSSCGEKADDMGVETVFRVFGSVDWLRRAFRVRGS